MKIDFLYNVLLIHFEQSQWAKLVDSTWILVDTSKNKFRRISTSFSRTFFDVISLVENFTWFPHTFWDAIHWSKNPRYFRVLFSMQFLWSKDPHCFHVLFSM